MDLNPPRTCGDCNLCCKVMKVPGVKDDHHWCQHAGRGCCNIYLGRPDPCREFNCLWLRDQTFGDIWYPKTAKIVIDIKVNSQGVFLAFVVDPSYPTRWREEPWFSRIKWAAREGCAQGSHQVGSAQGQRAGAAREQGWRTVVMIKDQVIPILEW